MVIEDLESRLFIEFVTILHGIAEADEAIFELHKASFRTDIL